MRDRVAIVRRLVLVAAALAGLAGPARPAAAQAAAPAFHELVDLRPLDGVAVFSEGRLKSFASFANTQMQFVTGPRRIGGQGSDFTYLDLMIRPKAYEEADIVYVKNKEVRARIAQAALAADPSLAEGMKAFEKSGLVSQPVLKMEPVRQQLLAMEKDLIRTAKELDAMKGALSGMDPQFLLSSLRMIPPGDGSADRPWASIGDIMLLGADPAQLPANLRERKVEPIPGIDEARGARIRE